MSHLMRATVYDEGDNILAFHLFHMPELCEKYCRRHGLSLECFKTLQRKRFDDWRDKNHPYPSKRFSFAFDTDCIHSVRKWEDVPCYEHTDIYEFYKAIGWSYVQKKFIG